MIKEYAIYQLVRKSYKKYDDGDEKYPHQYVLLFVESFLTHSAAEERVRELHIEGLMNQNWVPTPTFVILPTYQ